MSLISLKKSSRKKLSKFPTFVSSSYDLYPIEIMCISLGGIMFESVKKTLLTAIPVFLFTFLVLSFQNCAKPLDELSVNSSLAGGNCSITVPSSVYLNVNLPIKYSYNPSNFKIRLVVTQDFSGASVQNTYSQGGTLDVTYTTAGELGTYTVNGIVEDAMGVTAGTCLGSYVVLSPPTGGTGTTGTTTPPPTTYTYAWQISAWSACSVTACGLTGTQSRTVICKRNDGATVADSYCGTKPTTSQACSTAPCGGSTGDTGSDGSTGYSGDIGTCAIGRYCP